ncbi:MAG: S-methyl-5-thioribose-1-phosphate isomerase [Candidatus Cloacimonadota bacterium]|nr:MAG: S-methyl-5-thioribose-1-phosphate isomerase [Candidatus Cloacimonadota bacterium]PIE80822.1 MAG: S-methyl-5-thioribose-1-phosphate isomerase [Candidatus Delongbacteria bacterium]
MKIGGKDYRTIWFEGKYLKAIDQRFLPFDLRFYDLKSYESAVYAIKEMVVRGAPLIGVTGAAAVYLLLNDIKDGIFNISEFDSKVEMIKEARPTAINLKWGVERVISNLKGDLDNKIKIAKDLTNIIADEDVEMCRSIGVHGLKIIRDIYRRKGDTVNILTHCNAGWLATVDFGTATSPIYHAVKEGIPVHVWVDETRPRNQGGKLTAYELLEEGVKSTLITDNSGGILMQKGMVDLVIVGSDRTSVNGDVCNKIGTYLKALAAYDNKVPFYAALPISTFDLTIKDGVEEIPIENRSESEITTIEGVDKEGNIVTTRLTPDKVKVYNPGFDVTPSRLVTGLITDKGLIKPNREDILRIFK